MLSRKTDWSVLAQCDFYAVQNLVQTNDRIAMKILNPLKEPIFNRKIDSCSVWKEAYRSFCSAYENLKPTFSIRHDNYGGYKLVYTGKDSVTPPHVFKKNPIGIVTAIPKGAVTNLSVMTSERTGQELLSLGPLRFAKSDCNPNCEYDYSSDAGFVQLRLKRKVNPGDELLVKYGPQFFEENCCMCRTCEIREKEEKMRFNFFDGLVSELLHELSVECLDELQSAFKSPDATNKSKRRRIKGRELVEVFNELECSPVFSHESAQAPQMPLRDTLLCSPSTEVGINDNSYVQTPQIEDSDALTDCDTVEKQNNEEVAAQVVRASSPIKSYISLNCSLSTLSNEQVSLLESSRDENSREDSEPLYTGSQCTVRDASMLAELFCSRFHLSDECSNSLYSLIKGLLPEDNKFPSGYSHIKNIKDSFDNSVRFFTQTSEYSLCVLKFTSQLRDICSRYFRQITHYSQQRKANPQKDFAASLCPIVEWNINQKTTINLIIFSDGVNIKKSTYKKEIWPLWIQVADLPPKLRMSRKNIVLGALFVGEKYPSWIDLVPHLRDELCSEAKIRVAEQTFCTFIFKVRLLVADLGAKGHMLNMLKFNGFYGCHYCTAEGKTVGKTHAYYPYTQHGAIRESNLNSVFVEMAETMSVKQKTSGDHSKKQNINVVGVKGKSAFALILEGLPLSAPIDYMHCVLSGVFSDVLKTCYQSLTPLQKESLNSEVAQLSCPREMIAFSRKVRPLDELSQYKANELLNWLIYISPVLFLDYLSPKLYSHLCHLVFGIRLLLESSCQSNVSIADNFLNQFCSEIASIHPGNSRVETINVHCLKHLSHQVKRFGPLFCYSAMSFEAANRTIGEVFSGSNSECAIICRRVLQRHRLVDNKMENERLKTLYSNLSGGTMEPSNLKTEFIETETVRRIKWEHPNALLFNRQIVSDVYLDSPAYKRSKLGNCFVFFEKDGQEVSGKIQCFVKFCGPPFFSQTVACVELYYITEDIGLEKVFFIECSPQVIWLSFQLQF